MKTILFAALLFFSVSSYSQDTTEVLRPNMIFDFYGHEIGMYVDEVGDSLFLNVAQVDKKIKAFGIRSERFRNPREVFYNDLDLNYFEEEPKPYYIGKATETPQFKLSAFKNNKFIGEVELVVSNEIKVVSCCKLP